jgi:eukaryotic-like serine/threonine-protein kinase
MQVGLVLQQRYRMIQRVGQGGFGSVWLAQEVVRQQVIGSVAVKCFIGNPSLREIMTLSQLSHPNLIAYRAAFEQDGNVYLVMEYADGGDIGAMLKNSPEGLGEENTRRILLAVVEGLTYLHQRKIIHRDIKPANIFVSSGVVKLGDFGLAKAFEGQGASHTGMGTCEYSPPEFFNNQAFPQSDIYALGITCYELLTGRLPFTGSPAAIMKAHLTEQVPFTEDFPAFWRLLIQHCTEKEPTERWEAAAVLEALKKGRISGDLFALDAENPLKEVISDEVWLGIKIGKKILDVIFQSDEEPPKSKK